MTYGHAFSIIDTMSVNDFTRHWQGLVDEEVKPMGRVPEHVYRAVTEEERIKICRMARQEITALWPLRDRAPQARGVIRSWIWMHRANSRAGAP